MEIYPASLIFAASSRYSILRPGKLHQSIYSEITDRFISYFSFITCMMQSVCKNNYSSIQAHLYYIGCRPECRGPVVCFVIQLTGALKVHQVMQVTWEVWGIKLYLILKSMCVGSINIKLNLMKIVVFKTKNKIINTQYCRKLKVKNAEKITVRSKSYDLWRIESVMPIWL